MDTMEAWPRCPEAAAFFDRQPRSFAAANPLIEELAARFLHDAGVKLLNLIDHWTLPEGSLAPEELAALGLVEYTAAEGDRYWKHSEARLPIVRFKSKLAAPKLALAVEDIPAFVQVHELTLSGHH